MNNITTKEEAIELIYHSYNRVKQTVQNEKYRYKNNERCRELLDLVGRPDANKRIALVTGSKGKGSTATFISSLLTKLGFNTGLFTSPHLITFNERIQVNGQAISDDDFIRIANFVRPYVHQLLHRINDNEYLGPIAVSLAIAMLYFSDNNCDTIILEIGKGGLYDDTNVVKNKWAVITAIMDEHIEELGPTMADVVHHKLGIVKKTTDTVIVGKQKPEIMNMINEKLSSKTKNVYMYNNDFYVKQVTTTEKGMQFDIVTNHKTYSNLSSPVFGTYQSENISCAIQACELIAGFPIDQSLIADWLHSLDVPGKCEIIHREPTVMIDAAIHRNSVQYLEEVVKLFYPKKIMTIIGLSLDKDYKGVIETAAAFSDKIIISAPTNSYKHFSREKLIQYAKKYSPASVNSPLPDALSDTLLHPTHTVVILGNHSFIAEAKQWFQKRQNAE